MPISRSARMMRTAISPRLATRTFSNMAFEAYVLAVAETVDVRVAAPPGSLPHHVAALDEPAQARAHARRRRIAEGIAQLAEGQRPIGRAQALDEQPRLRPGNRLAIALRDLEPRRVRRRRYRGEQRRRGRGRGGLPAPLPASLRRRLRPGARPCRSVLARALRSGLGTTPRQGPRRALTTRGRPTRRASPARPAPAPGRGRRRRVPSPARGRRW